MNQISKSFFGYCPQQKCNYQIEAIYHVFPITQSNDPGYKLSCISCDYAAEHSCSYCGGTGADCPILKSADLS